MIAGSGNWTLSRREWPGNPPRPAWSGRVTDSIHLDSRARNRPNPTANPHRHQPLDGDDDGGDDVVVVAGGDGDDVVVVREDDESDGDADGRRRRHRRRCLDVESIHFLLRRRYRRLLPVGVVGCCCPGKAG